MPREAETVRLIRVFVSSPGDVAAEREALEEAIAFVNDTIGRDRTVRVESFRWEKDVVPQIGPLPQDVVDEQTPACDIYIGIMSTRFGTPTGDHGSGTEKEFRDAHENWGKTGTPWIAFYFDDDPKLSKKPADVQQYLRVCEFREELEKIGIVRGYTGVRESKLSFYEQAQKHLHQLVSKFTAPDTTARCPSKTFPRKLEMSEEITRYCKALEARHAKLELAGFKSKLRVSIDLNELYVPLNAHVDLRGLGEAEFADAADAEERLIARGAAREIALAEALREATRRGRRGVVILGDPGSGKTTYLKVLMLSCLRERAAELGLSADVLPAYLPLRDLTDLSRGLDAFVARELESPHLKMGEGFGARLLARGRLLLLFDGLDEVADPEEREQVTRWIESAAQAPWCSGTVVTCRFAGYRGAARLAPDFLELHLRPMTPEQSETYIGNWYHAVETQLADDPEQGEVTARNRSAELIDRLREPDFRAARLVEMTRNPLLLANLCLVHRDRGALPRGRANLYDECVDVLLERWREGKRLPVRVTAKDGRRVLQPAALWMHAKEGRTRASAQELEPILEPALRAVQWKSATESGATVRALHAEPKKLGSAAEFLRAVRDDSGLLTGWGPDQFGFMHLGFQEYLAACEVGRLAFEGDDTELVKLAERYGESWWQEVILLLMGRGNPSLFKPFMREVVKRPSFERAPQLLSWLLEDAAEVSESPFEELLRLPPKRDHRLWARQRQALAALEQLGRTDTLAGLEALMTQHPAPEIQQWLTSRITERPVIKSQRGGVPLVAIPAGSFTMGSPLTEEGRDSTEGPQHHVRIASFYLGQTPVTNDQYRKFLEANPDAKEPEYWSDRRFNGAQQPVVGVSWHDARAFAEWAGGRLPSEAEWEYAARAGTKTAYWWGDEVGENRANGCDCGSRWGGDQTSPVDAFAANRFGLHDMLGNVWEWVGDCWHDNYQGAPADGSAWGKEDGGDCDFRVLRGGSWGNRPGGLRCSARVSLHPDGRGGGVGFRLAQDL